MENKSDQTISSSKEESLLKAIELFEEEQKKNTKTISRPNINLGKVIFKKLFRLLAFAVTVIIFFILEDFIPEWFCWPLCGVVLLLEVLVFLGGAVTEWVLIYQRYAPYKLRSSCLFEPSCSEYMLLSIEKYGAVKGVLKGIGRIFRCHQPNGGIDYP